MKYGDFLNIMSSRNRPLANCSLQKARRGWNEQSNFPELNDWMHQEHWHSLRCYFTLCQFHSRYNSLLSLSNVEISRMDRNIIHKNEIVGILYQITFKFTLYTLYTRLSWILDWVSMQVLVLGYMRRTWAFLTHNGI